MNRHIDQLSQLILEADALLLLLYRHKEATPTDAIILLKRKLNVILSLIDDIEEESEVYENEEQATEIVTPVETNDYVRDADVPETPHIHEIKTEDNTTFFTQPEIAECSKDDITWNEVTDDIEDLVEGANAADAHSETHEEPLPETRFAEIAEKQEPVKSYTPEPTPAPVEKPVDHQYNYSVEAPETTIKPEPMPEPSPKPEPAIAQVEKTVETPQPVSATSPTSPSKQPGSRRPVSSVFNLNDKFRFRRELFGNSEVAYVECLNMLSAMYSLDEATDYLYEDLNWDPNNEDVKSFVEILKIYYNN